MENKVVIHMNNWVGSMFKLAGVLILLLWPFAVLSAVQTASFSFETGTYPANWSSFQSGDESSVNIERGDASDGEFAVSLVGGGYGGTGTGVEWTDEFETGKLSFDVNQMCSFSVEINGFVYNYSFSLLDDLERIQWASFSINLPAGQHTIRFVLADRCRTLKLDNFRYSPLTQVANPYHLNQGVIVGLFGRHIHVFSEDGVLLEKILIPRGPDVNSFADPSDVIVTEDGDIIVYSDGYPGTISIYSPSLRTWNYYRADGMGNSTGRLAYLNGKLYITNWGQTLGLFVFDLTSHSFQHHLEGENFIDIVAKNGSIYVTPHLDSEGPKIVRRLNPATLSTETEISTSERSGLIAIDDSGNAYSKQWDEIVAKYSPTGTLIDSISFESHFYSLDNILVQNSTLFLVVGGELQVFDLDLNYLETIKFPYTSVYDQWVVAVYGKGRDTDGDGMSDRWEEHFGFSIDDASDASLDSDGDGLTNLQEYLHTTQPHDSDSDDDGLLDGDEVDIHGSVPTKPDTDEDGLDDGVEVNTHASSPLNKDSDGDGLSDSSEVSIYLTSPINDDTDLDGLLDSYEVLNGLDPLVDDSTDDTDSDGLVNIDEFTEGTDPNDSDSDNDGILDGDEVNLHATLPMNSDTDGDLIPDGAEVQAVLDPLDSGDATLDNDGDGYDNLWEYFAKSSLNDADDIPETRAWNNFRSNHWLNPYFLISLNVSNFESLWHLEANNTFESSNVLAVDGTVFLKNDDAINWINGSTRDLIKSFDIDGTIVAYDAPYLYIEKDGLLKLNVFDGELVFDNELRYAVSESGTLHEGVVYGGGGTGGSWGISAVDVETGEVLWVDNDDSLRNWGVAVDDSYVYNHTYDGLVARNKANGEVAFNVDVEDCSASVARFSLASQKRAILMNSSYPGCVAVIDLEAQSLLWRKSLASEAGFVEANGVLYLLYQGDRDTNFDSVLQAYDMANGDLLWEKQMAGDSYGSSMVATNNILFVSQDGETIAFDLASQEQVWSFDQGGDLILSNHGVLYISTYSQGLYAIKVEGDTDNDEVDDWYERLYKLNYISDLDRELDADGDGLNNYQEFILGTSSDNSDSDFDGLADGIEIEVGSNPTNLDSDGDSISDGEEYHIYGTSPASNDTDGDGLLDDFEIFELGSNPISSDSDLDGMQDEWEHINGTDILVDDSANDLDGDEASNLSEFQIGTDPQNPDTDGDTLVDGWESRYGFDPLVAQTEADPDNDELENYYEYLAGTNPLVADSDGDSMPDGWERFYGLQPLIDDNNLDPDEDGALNLEEYNSDTNPIISDKPDEGPGSGGGGCSVNPQAKFDPLFVVIILFAFAHLSSSRRKCKEEV
jgi:hypothetical protein